VGIQELPGHKDMKNHYGLHPCDESRAERRAEPDGRLMKGKPSVLYRNHKFAS
jgi:hypothetical protein